MHWYSSILNYFKTGPDAPRLQDPSRIRKLYERYRTSVFLSVTIGYGFFYVCRLNFSVAKKEMLTEHILTADQMGFIGFVMLIVYAFGKFFNGLLADRSNIRRFMSVALAVSAATNLLLGVYPGFVLFAILWGINGWFQAVGAAPSVVSRVRIRFGGAWNWAETVRNFGASDPGCDSQVCSRQTSNIHKQALVDNIIFYS